MISVVVRPHDSEDVLEASVTYFGGDHLAASTFTTKYALRENGKFLELTPQDMHDRLAREFARIEAKYIQAKPFAVIREALDGFERIVPQGSPMFGIGNPYVRVSLSNCSVISPPTDSVSGILDTGKNLANLMKRRAGVGVDISTLRPEGMSVNNAALTTTGAWSFADFFSYVTRMIGQSGRRGALMLTLDVRHPDVDRFVTMKHDLTKVTGANVSVRITDDFMRAVEKDEEWICRWPIDGEAKVTKTMRARDLWRLINESAIKTAEPGLLFWDNYTKNLPAHCYPEFETVSVNPCSEIGLSAYDSCRLASINLKGYVRNAFEASAQFDYSSFEADVRLAMRLMDDLVDLEIEHLTEIINTVDEDDEKDLWTKIRQAAIEGRRTGLGTHALADCLACLNIRYDSDAALTVVDRIYKTFRNAAYDESVNLAVERGPFPVFNWELEKHCEFIKRLPKSLRERMSRHGRRNISLLTMAPTGSVSILSQTSSGIEPVFSYFYTRRKKINPSDPGARADFEDVLGDKWEEYMVFHHNVAKYLEKKHPDILYKWNDVQAKTEPNGWMQALHGLLQPILPEYFVSANDIDPRKRVEIQGIIQRYIDHGISSTINLPRGTTVEQGDDLYRLAWVHGLKGVTIYVDGSRSGVLVTHKTRSIQENHAPKRPDILPCDIHYMTVGGDRWIFLVGLLDDKPYELFGGLAENFHLPKRPSGGQIVRRKAKINTYDLHADGSVVDDVVETFANPNYAVMTRLLSANLRHGVPIQFVVQQLTRDPSPDFTSFSRVAARVLKKYIHNGTRTGEQCVQCGAKLVFEDGCFGCKQCGFSKCD